jgi:Helix-turn-helix domain
MTMARRVAVRGYVTTALISLRMRLRPTPRATQLLCSTVAFLVTAHAGSVGPTHAAAASRTGTNVSAFVAESWRMIDGLPQGSVTALAQTTNGYLWLDTRGGLARFDGLRFSTFGPAEDLKSANIWCLADDWQGGLQHRGPGGFTRVGEAVGIRGTVMALTPVHAGGLWVGTFRDGLLYCEDGRSERAEGPPTQRQFIGYRLVVDTTEALWVSIGNGMVLRRQTGESKAATGASWMKFLQGYRIHRALALLSEPGHNVREVALAAGFDSLSHFNTTFHSFMGVSPQHYFKKI